MVGLGRGEAGPSKRGATSLSLTERYTMRGISNINHHTEETLAGVVEEHYSDHGTDGVAEETHADELARLEHNLAVARKERDRLQALEQACRADFDRMRGQLEESRRPSREYWARFDTAKEAHMDAFVFDEEEPKQA